MNPVQRIRSWFRTVLPFENAVIGLVVTYCLIEAAHLITLRPGRPLRWGFLPEENEAVAVIALIAALIYGGFRAVYFHPFFRKEYREWLIMTPWSASRRLPFGPVHLVVQDVIVVGLLSLAGARGGEFTWVTIPLAFLLPYLVLSMLALMNTGQGPIAYAMALTMGALIRWANDPPIVAGILVALYAQALWGLRRSLRAFHEWDLQWWTEQGLADLMSNNFSNLAELSQNRLLGWPFERLSLKRAVTSVSIRQGCAAGVLIAWWLSGALNHIFRNAGGGPLPPEAVSAGLAVPCLVLMAFRVGIYVTGYAPPISLLGRIATFRWIIPGYDQVFLAPIVGALLVAFGPQALAGIGLPWEFGIAALIGLLVIVALSMPPTLDQWRLTGHHRIVPAVQFQQQLFVETR